MGIVGCWFQRTLKQLEREQTDTQTDKTTTVTLAHARRGLITRTHSQTHKHTLKPSQNLTCLSVGKDAGVVPTEGILQHISPQFLKDQFLTTELGILWVHGPEAVVECKRLKKGWNKKYIARFVCWFLRTFDRFDTDPL